MVQLLTENGDGPIAAAHDLGDVPVGAATDGDCVQLSSVRYGVVNLDVQLMMV